MYQEQQTCAHFNEMSMIGPFATSVRLDLRQVIYDFTLRFQQTKQQRTKIEFTHLNHSCIRLNIVIFAVS